MSSVVDLQGGTFTGCMSIEGPVEVINGVIRGRIKARGAVRLADLTFQREPLKGWARVKEVFCRLLGHDTRVVLFLPDQGECGGSS